MSTDPAVRPAGKRRAKQSPAAMAKARRIVFPRDNWTCQDCGTRIPPTCADEESGRRAPGIYGTGVCLELDHIIPVKVGGLFIVENLQALCSRCNARKGASPEFAGWPERFIRVQQILDTKAPSASTARAIVLILTGRSA